MSFEPDVIVLAPGTPELVLAAEIRRAMPNLHGLETHLKHYMLGMACPLGLLVTPELTWIYSDTFVQFSIEAIERVGEYVTGEVLHDDRNLSDATVLAASVRAWLERLAARWPSDLPSDPDVRSVWVEHVAPTVAHGRVLSVLPRPLPSTGA